MTTQLVGASMAPIDAAQDAHLGLTEPDAMPIAVQNSVYFKYTNNPEDPADVIK